MTTLILVAVAAFASTNLDDLFVLLSLFADPSLRPAEVVAGQFIGMAILTLSALAGSLLVLIVPGTYVGLLGLLPLAIGLRRLWTQQDGSDSLESRSRWGALGKVIAAAAVTTASGGDNIAVYVPLLVKKSWSEVSVVVAVFGIMTAAWCVIARIVVDHPRTGPPIRRFGRLLVPWIYLGLSAYILGASRAYTLVGSGGK